MGVFSFFWENENITWVTSTPAEQTSSESGPTRPSVRNSGCCGPFDVRRSPSEKRNLIQDKLVMFGDQPEQTISVAHRNYGRSYPQSDRSGWKSGTTLGLQAQLQFFPQILLSFSHFSNKGSEYANKNELVLENNFRLWDSLFSVDCWFCFRKEK